jgi:hypothetical protein
MTQVAHLGKLLTRKRAPFNDDGLCTPQLNLPWR